MQCGLPQRLHVYATEALVIGLMRLVEEAVDGLTHEVGPVCLKESDEEIYRYFQNLLVDAYSIDIK